MARAPLISVNEATKHLNVTDGWDNQLIERKLYAACEWVAGYTGMPLFYDPDNEDAPIPTVPAPVREAVLQLTAHLYENREATLVGVTAQHLPFGFLDLLANYRAYSF